jgi:hypothetical protein
MRVRDTLEWVWILNWLWRGCENRMRWHGVETTRRLDVWWPDGLVMRTEIEGSAAQFAGPAEHV